MKTKIKIPVTKVEEVEVETVVVNVVGPNRKIILFGDENSPINDQEDAERIVKFLSSNVRCSVFDKVRRMLNER